MTRIFVSYSHADQRLRSDLDKHLSLLKRNGEIDVWSDHRIEVGEPIDEVISDALEQADIILLLVSSDFLASDYCYGVEMLRAMERHDAGEAAVVPVILRPCDFQSAPFGRLKAVPTDARPLTKWPSEDDAFLDIVRHLRSLLQRRGSAAKEEVRQAATLSTGGAAPVSRSSNLALPVHFSDQDRHDFTQSSFDYIREYFEQSLKELERRNDGIASRLTVVSPRAFTVVIFRYGKRVSACGIRIGGLFSDSGIAYSASDNVDTNSYNEHMSIEADKHSLYLKASMSMFHNRDSEAKLTQEGASEHLWSMLISPLQSRV